MVVGLEVGAEGGGIAGGSMVGGAELGGIGVAGSLIAVRCCESCGLAV